MSTSGSVKLSFLLTEEEAGPYPIGVENIWCDREDYYFRVKNIPFFLLGLSYDDLISVRMLDGEDVQVEEIVEESTNSTIWIYFMDISKGTKPLDDLRQLGCLAEGGIFPGYFAVNVPEDVDIEQVYAIIDTAEEEQLIANYPSIRHG